VSPPLARLSPASIDEAVEVGGDVVRAVHLANDGGRPLDFFVEVKLQGAGEVTAADTTFRQLQRSPVPMSCVVEDPVTGQLYAQAGSGGSGFYRYRATADVWESLMASPISSSDTCGAALLGGNIYTANPTTSMMGIYNIATNAWSAAITP